MAVLPGTTGNDIYTGTTSGSDTAVIGANSASATFSFDGTRWIVTSGAGSDTLSSVESVQFADRTFNLVVGLDAAQMTGQGFHTYSSVARLADGGWVVATQSSDDGSGAGIVMQRFNAAGEMIGAETRVNTIIDYAQTQPSATGLAGGGYVVAWQTQSWNASFTEFQYKVVYQTFDAAGNKVGGEVPMGSNTTGMIDLEVAATANGGFAATWSERTGTGTALMARLYDSNGGSVGGPVPLATGLDSSSATNVEIVALGNGYVAVWEQVDGAGTSVFQQRMSSTGAKIGSVVKVSGSEASNEQPAVAGLDDGSYVVAWTAVGGSGQGVHVQRFAGDGTKIGAAFPAHGDSQVYSYESIAATGLEGGGFVVVWRGMHNGTQSLYLQRFDSLGSPVDTIQRVKQYANQSSAYDPDVVSLPNGGFVVTWTESNQVYTQRFNADGIAFMSEISGTAANDVITFTGGTLVKLVGKAGHDSLTGGSGNDVLDGGGGADTMTGGAGNDTYVWQAGDTIVELVGGGVDTVRTSVSYTLSSRYLENAVLTGSAKGDLVGNGNSNRLTGNGADNVLNGGGGADTLTGGGGNDTFVVDDLGDRTIEAAGGGVDTVISSVTTVLAADLEHLRLGGAVDINGTGNSGANLITGNAYANRLDGRDGTDTMIGGLGDDTYVVETSAMDDYREYEREGSDTLEIDSSWALNSALDSIENLTLREGGEFSGIGDRIGNVIRGNSQANLIDGKAGADTMDGGGGDDTYVVDNAGDVASEIGWGNVDLVKSSITHTLGTNIENLTLLTAADLKGVGNDISNLITGNAGANSLNGLYGYDTLIGGAGNDMLISADGFDSMMGGMGNDSYFVASENDEIIEKASEGTDSVVASVERSYTLSDHVERLRLIGLHVDGHGNTLNNAISGTTGNNLLDGATGADTLTGFAGADAYIVDNVGDLVIEDVSNDRDEVFATVSYTLRANVEYLTLGGSAAINGAGNALNNRLIGNDSANKLSGGAGADLLMGYAGADQLIGGTGADTLKGGIGNDTYDVDSSLDVIVEMTSLSSEIDSVKSIVSWALGANLENLALLGSAQINGTGNALANTLIGNSAANVLDGGAGLDTLTGGAGADTFSFSTALSATGNVDRIKDFSVADDTIRLENGVFKALGNAGALAPANLRAGANVTTAADGNDFLLYNSTTGALYYDADGSGAAFSAVRFATLTTGLALTAADFLIF